MIHALLGLLGCQLAGEVICRLTGLPVPGPVLGLVLMVIFLLIRRSVPASVETAAQTLLSHLSLLFVPAGVGIVSHLHRVRDEWLPLSVALVLSTAITIAVTALTFHITQKILGRRSVSQETPQ